MPEIELDKTTTALLIADFYVEMMGSLPHAVDRKVVDKTRALQRAARGAFPASTKQPLYGGLRTI